MAEREGIMPMPPDEIRMEDGRLKGAVYFLTEKGNPNSITPFAFDIKPGRTLTPFWYRRPIVDPEDPFGPPVSVELDLNTRQGHFPLAIVRGVLRDPHLYEPDDGIITAFKPEKGDWGVRYYPKKTIDLTVMDEAWQILRGTRPSGL